MACTLRLRVSFFLAVARHLHLALTFLHRLRSFTCTYTHPTYGSRVESRLKVYDPKPNKYVHTSGHICDATVSLDRQHGR